MSFPRRQFLRASGAVLLGLAFADVAQADEQPSSAKIPSAEPISGPGEAQISPLQLTKFKSDDPLIRQVQEAVEISTRRYLDADVHTPWQIMHGILAYRHEYQIKQKGKLISALEYVSNGPAFEGTQWFEKTQYGGRGHTYTKPYAFEGHPNQFQAIMTLSELPLDHEFKARDATLVPSDRAPKPQTADATITMSDMVNSAKMEVNAREEITWTLWFLSFYVSPEAQWNNKHGEPWSMERLVKMQTDAPPYNAACGGTHGLFALARARNAYIQTGRPLHGVWLQADQKINHYIQVARAYQNADGSFSSEYFKGPGYSNDFAKRLATSGHILEVLMVALPQNRLNEEWVRRGVQRLTQDILDNRTQPAECGALYHALDALVIYLQRVQPPAPETKEEAETTRKDVEQAAGSDLKPTEPPALQPAGTMD